ncbi:MAG: prepilin-type N-terminal cleavage/methylation domain-containing protein [Phycisphaerales bacterium]|nr:prepilin-type N-terminal cleavage/methylation domain-containing protein [Phycisphaerales bacterium]
MSFSRAARRTSAPIGFTLVELVVVIAVIGLVLAFAVPALNNMTGESKLLAAVQTVNGVLTRAYYASQADRQLTAVRFMPGAWDFTEGQDPQAATSRQHIVSYSWVTATDREVSGSFNLQLREQFQRRPSSESIQLPPDIWAAPVEAWRDSTSNREHNNMPTDMDALTGRRGRFDLSARSTSPGSSDRMMSADDFVIAFDPQSGLKSQRERVRLRGYVPMEYPDTALRGLEVDDNGQTGSSQVFYDRYTSAGVVVYRREPFAALGDTAAPEDRQRILRAHGRAYFVHRYGGGLVLGTAE